MAEKKDTGFGWSRKYRKGSEVLNFNTDIAQEKVWEVLEDLDVDISITITKPSGGGVPYIKSVDTEDDSEIDDFEGDFDSELEGMLEI